MDPARRILVFGIGPSAALPAGCVGVLLVNVVRAARRRRGAAGG
jgi:hypothetical protein